MTIVDVQHVGIEPHAGITPGEIVGKGPMRRRPPPVEQASFGQHIGTETQADHLGATPVGRSQGIEQCRRGPLGRVAPARHNHGIGGRNRLQAVADLDSKTGGRAQWPRLIGAHPQIENRQAGMAVAENDAGHRQMKGTDAIEGKNGNHGG